MTTKKRYVLHPGWVWSRTDGDRHFIPAAVLARLYKVPLRECVVHRPGDVFTGVGLPKNLVHLYPRYDGDYTLEKNPVTSKKIRVDFRLNPNLLQRIDRWRREQPTKVTRTAVVEKAIEMFLETYEKE